MKPSRVLHRGKIVRDENYRRYNKLNFHPVKIKVYDVRTGKFVDQNFPIINPITLDPSCQRARIRKAKKEARQEHLRLAIGL